MPSFSGFNELQAYIVIQGNREICTQILLAFKSFDNITKKGEGDLLTTFSSIHSYLTHCANISKLLWSTRDKNGNSTAIEKEIGKNLADVIGVSNLPLLRDKSFRNDLDHYDDRLVAWIKEELPKHQRVDPARMVVSDLTIGKITKKKGIRYLRNYDPDSKVYTYEDRDLNLEELRNELLQVQAACGCAVLVT